MEIQNLKKSFNQNGKKLEVLDKISFNVKEGEVLVLLGPSGCGKTTLLNILANIESKDEGIVSVDYSKEEIGYMFQTPLLLDWRNVFDNILLSLQIKDKVTSNKKSEISRLLKKYDLDNFKENYPKTLSGGMKQRIAFIRTIITEPSILFLDEPFSSLDFQTKLRLEEELFDFTKNKKIKTIFVTHDIEEAIALGDRVLVLTKRPARIKKEHIINLKEKNPIKRRQEPKFGDHFKKLWRDLKDETRD